MLKVRTFLGKSSIDGVGLFLAEPIKKGTITWEFIEGFDQAIDEDTLKSLSLDSRQYIEKYGYLSKKSGLYVICYDDSRFMNHSDSPTTEGAYPSTHHLEGVDIAARDLEIGEELTCDYKTFEARTLSW